MGAMHNAMCETAWEDMDANRKRQLAEAATVVAEAAGITRDKLTDLLVEAQESGTLVPEFEATLRAMKEDVEPPPFDVGKLIG